MTICNFFVCQPKSIIFIGWANEEILTIIWLHKEDCIFYGVLRNSNLQLSLSAHFSWKPLVVEICLWNAKLTFLTQAKFSIFDFLSMSTCSDFTAILRIFVWNDFSGGFFSMKEGSYRKTNTTFTVTTFWGYEAKVGLFFRFEVVLRSETGSKVKHLWQGGDQWKKIIGQIHLTTNDLFGTLYLASNLLRNRFKLTRPIVQVTRKECNFPKWLSFKNTRTL